LMSGELFAGETVRSAIRANYCLPVKEIGRGWVSLAACWTLFVMHLWPLVKLFGLPSLQDYNPVSGVLYLTSHRLLFKGYTANAPTCNCCILLPAVQTCTLKPGLRKGVYFVTVQTSTRNELFVVDRAAQQISCGVVNLNPAENVHAVCRAYLLNHGLPECIQP